MSLSIDEKEWIKQYLVNGHKIASSSDRDEILDALHDFTVSELYDNDLSPTQACREAEEIIEHVARYWDE